jgi:lipopolysaccharide transport system ATP-binding protein
MKTVIRVENVSKEYKLGELGTGTLSRDLNAIWAKWRGQENPNSKIFDKRKGTVSAETTYHKALDNVSFEVNEGDVLALIGKNGAGKSTMLKLLSRVTKPSSGNIYVKGRIASLLEVGTGFHPELTGMDNIFLNGAILGMRKEEIKHKLDEIIDFSGVEKYINTPVKRYSSGMYVRLAFAVAAHLEPEILVVDEVLAVGDIEFQNKCLGKMGEVSKQGRTILFVSHNMQALSQLCTKSIVLKEGSKIFDGGIQDGIRNYLSNSTHSDSPVYDLKSIKERRGAGLVRFKKLEILNNGVLSNNFMIGENMELRITVEAFQPIKTTSIAIHIYRYDESIIANIENIDSRFVINNLHGETTFSVRFNDLRLYPETYKLGFWIANTESQETQDHLEVCAQFNVIEGSNLVIRKLNRNRGVFYYTPEWNYVQ